MSVRFGLAFWGCAALVSAFVVGVFGHTVGIPLNAEDLQVYVNYFFFTGDDLMPEAFYGNAFGILPGEFVYKVGRTPEEVGGVYRPLTAGLMALDFAICGTGSLCYHITNLLLGIACSIAVLALAWYFCEGRWLPAVAAAFVFSVNPTHSLSLVIMLQRSDILCTLFYVLSVLFFARYIDGQGKRPVWDYGLSLVFMVLALMSKEMAATLPIALLAYDVYAACPEGHITLASAPKIAKRHTVFWAVLVLYLLFRIAAFGGIGGYPGFCLEKDLDTPSAFLLGRHNITNAISGLNHLFGVSSMSRLVRYSLIAAVFVPLLFGTGRRVKLAIALVPISMLPVLTQTSIVPLYMFLSSAWFSIGAAASLLWLLERLVRRRAGLVVFVVLVGALVGTFASMVNGEIATTRRRIEFAYQTANEITRLVSPMPKGARILLVTASMLESSGRVDFDPAIEPVLRLMHRDHSLKLWPIPLNVERDALMELSQAAALDMEAVQVDEKTYFLDKLSGQLRLRPDLRQRFSSRTAIRTLPGRAPGDYYGWTFDQSLFGWSVSSMDGSAIEARLSDGCLVFPMHEAGAQILSPQLQLATARPDRFRFKMKIEGQGLPGSVLAWVEWVSDTYPAWSVEQSRTITLNTDGQFHTYVVEPGKDFHWITADTITRMRIRLSAMRATVYLKEAMVYFGQAPSGLRQGEAPVQDE